MSPSVAASLRHDGCALRCHSQRQDADITWVLMQERLALSRLPGDRLPVPGWGLADDSRSTRSLSEGTSRPQGEGLSCHLPSEMVTLAIGPTHAWHGSSVRTGFLCSLTVQRAPLQNRLLGLMGESSVSRGKSPGADGPWRAQWMLSHKEVFCLFLFPCFVF